MSPTHALLAATIAATLTAASAAPADRAAPAPAPVALQGCDRAGPSVRETWAFFARWQRLRYETGNGVLTDATSAVGTTAIKGIGWLGTTFIQEWQRQANDTWASLDMRHLEPGAENQGGNVVSRATRRWISPPLVGKPFQVRRQTVRVRELDGQGRTVVTVCSYPESGRGQVEGSFVFNDTRAQKNDRREVWELAVAAADKVLVVEVDGRSVGNTFQYVIEID